MRQNIQICFAGAENNPFFVLAYAAGVRNFLFSVYSEIAKKMNAPGRDMIPPGDCPVLLSGKFPANIVIMDSGLFTLLYGAGKNKSTPQMIFTWFDKLVEYILKIPEISRPICVEVDAQGIIGVEETWTLRHRFREALPNTQIMNVIHDIDGLKGAERIAEFSDYVGLACTEASRVHPNGRYVQKLKNFSRYLGAKYPGKKIHWLGGTSRANLAGSNLDVTTADSTCWLDPCRYGFNCLAGEGPVMSEKEVALIQPHVGELLNGRLGDHSFDKTPARSWSNAIVLLAASAYLKKYSAWAGEQVRGPCEFYPYFKTEKHNLTGV